MGDPRGHVEDGVLMDPDACLKLWRSAVCEGNRRAVRRHAADLREWIAKGGFEPRWGVGERYRVMRRAAVAS